jgi:exonuclease III
MVQAALSSLFSGTYQLLAAQEVPSSDSAKLLQTILPGSTATWQYSFFDTTDTMDNGFWYRTGITLRDSFPLFVADQKDASGRIITDETRAVHPPQVAQFEVGDFDFTFITVHLTFADGNTSESARELRGILDYLDWYFSQPDHDPDVIVCGDFNMPSALTGQKGKDGITLDSVFDQDPRFQAGERRFAVTVHEPTTRSSAETGGLPVSNYDHCVFSASTMKEFIQARRVSSDILTDNPDDPEMRLTSDHFPIVAFLKTRGDGITLDRKTLIRPQAAPTISTGDSRPGEADRVAAR